MSRHRQGPRLQLQLTRVLQLAKRIDGASHRPGLTALADEFRVHPRTVRRDLQALRAAGWPVPPSRPHVGDPHAA